jgi:hypothetical protein
MAYIIYVPGVPQPYVTNDPRIYVDCLHLLKWDCESRPFHDEFCKALRADGDERGLTARRIHQLEAYWVESLERHTKPRKEINPLEENTTISTEETVEKLAEHDIDKSVLSEIEAREGGAL